ncbi:MAG: Rieske 2Fe-2S domain-containing protein [Planctomycetota bacterium]
MGEADQVDVGAATDWAEGALREVKVGHQRVAVSRRGDTFGAVSGTCNHVGGPLGHGTLEGDYIVCPWHYWKFHRETGEGEPGYEEDRVPRYDVEVKDGRVLVSARATSKRGHLPHPPHALAREAERHEGPPRVVGISTTNMDVRHPRTSTSKLLLEHALEHASTTLGLETRLIDLAALSFRACEGFYSKSAHACTWPCSITQMDKKDQLDQVYEALVHWADIVLLATPIRWGAASSLYQKMIERLNCVQNQVTLRNRVLIRDKVAAFVITGGQDNVQAVAGSALGFFAELGFVFPPFPYVAHSRGWSAEDMENNVRAVENSEELREGTRALVERAVTLSSRLRAASMCAASVPRGGRKAHRDRGASPGADGSP